MFKAKKCAIEICNLPAFSKGYCKKHCDHKTLKKYNKETKEKRQKEREGYSEFFQKHIDIIKKENRCCEECGEKLVGHLSEVAHVFPKSTFKSVAKDDKNVLYLCGMYSNNQCHANFDNFSTEKVKEMIIYPKICCIFAELEEDIKEKINYKVYEKYTWQV